MLATEIKPFAKDHAGRANPDLRILWLFDLKAAGFSDLTEEATDGVVLLNWPASQYHHGGHRFGGHVRQ